MKEANRFTIRRAEPADYQAVATTFANERAYSGTLQMPFPSQELWKKRLAEPDSNNVMLVVEADGEVIANAGLHPALAGNIRRRHAMTLGMTVRDDWQGKGAGTKLMSALVDLADNWFGALRLELTVYTDNVAAIALYRKFGFEVEGTHRAYALRGGVLVDAFAMARLHPHPPLLAPANDTEPQEAGTS